MRPCRVDLVGVGAHHVLSSLFSESAPRSRVFGFDVEREEERRERAGSARLAVGRIRVTSLRTRESAVLSYAAIRFGDHSLAAGLRPFRSDEHYDSMQEGIVQAFRVVDFPAVLRIIDGEFGGATFSLKSLFRDEQRRVLDLMLEGALADAEERYGRIYEAGEPLMRHLTHFHLPIPRAFEAAAEIVMNRTLRVCLEADVVDEARVRRAIGRARESGVVLDAAGLERTMQKLLERLVRRLRESPEDVAALEQVDAALSIVGDMPFEVDPWSAQNTVFEMMREQAPSLALAAAAGDDVAAERLARLRDLADRLKLRIA